MAGTAPPAPANEPRDPTKRYTKYELIGQGAQKKVYRAFDEERGIEPVGIAAYFCNRGQHASGRFQLPTYIGWGGRHGLLTIEDDDGSEGEEEEGACSWAEGEAPDDPARPCCGRSQPVSLQVRTQQAAQQANMALSFAMSFTNQRGVRKKVGFQYDMVHDTASAIALEMVENLSLNTAEADAIAAMIQHEVSRFGREAKPA
ncbi:hypothetical protein TSOC_009703 [Tetrabaena socialis]|uniref:non-specific serine/threonine protein kinase n=1 Tax=Tetrabaena socialis TaxID=47790 RepID=A0A2J7ZVA8_9CHLO|nr:hypothetical protein TSOC_009703 [Tetrabaena socialis]|eukprot:PNH04168.1 hypothetical protein TSOC_009703 [Tetrabaena socialis]